MSFEDFQNQARMYVIGALESDLVEEFEVARKELGEPADRFVAECYDLHEAFALSLQPKRSSEALKSRLMAMVRERKAD